MLPSAVLVSLVSSDRCAWPTCPDSSRQPRATRPRPTSLRQHLWAGPTASEPCVGVAVNALRRSLIRPRGHLLFFPPSLLAENTACRLSLTPAVHPLISMNREVPPCRLIARTNATSVSCASNASVCRSASRL